MHADRNSMDLWQGRVDPEADSPRWHQRIQELSADSQPGVALLGFASDEGVRRNHGRVGAVGGPLAMRKALANLAWHRQGAAYDAGDVLCADGDLENAQARLGHNVCALLDAGHLPVVLGGGHEVAFGSWQGIAEHMAGAAAPRIGIINFDALMPVPPVRRSRRSPNSAPRAAGRSPMPASASAAPAIPAPCSSAPPS
jgi:formiminoglutamase